MARTLSDTSAPGTVLVACLCAEWCTACRAYRSVFEGVAAENPDLRFLWIDIEDSAALLDGIDVENFPTILIARGEVPTFLGMIMPQREVLQRLIAAHRGGSLGGALDPEVSDFVARLRDVPG